MMIGVLVSVVSIEGVIVCLMIFMWIEYVVDLFIYWLLICFY